MIIKHLDTGVPVTITTGSSLFRTWDAQGHCSEQVNQGEWSRRPDLDFGTPLGDLLFEPWLQAALKED